MKQVLIILLLLSSQSLLIAQSHSDIEIKSGTGSFSLPGGPEHEEDTIEIFYYKPSAFTPESKILIVVPGSGRDGDEYRDAWIAEAEKHNVLVLFPMYLDKDYDFGQYHMGGLMYDMNIKESVEYVSHSNEVVLDEEKFSYQVNADPQTWLFNDFDRIFDLVVKHTGSLQSAYDLFGHSAGGQILHRLVLFQSGSKANKILASNSGFYTLPGFDSVLPFGLQNTPLKARDMSSSFARQLVLFIGENDNEHETGGTLLRSPSADAQGLHRLARSKYFYSTAQQTAKDMNADFNWKLEIVADTGHDFRKMSKAAADYLYH